MDVCQNLLLKDDSDGYERLCYVHKTIRFRKKIEST